MCLSFISISVQAIAIDIMQGLKSSSSIIQLSALFSKNMDNTKQVTKCKEFVYGDRFGAQNISLVHFHLLEYGRKGKRFNIFFIFDHPSR